MRNSYYRYLLLILPFFLGLSCSQGGDEPQGEKTEQVSPGQEIEQASHRDEAVELDSFGFRVDTLQVSEHKVRPNESLYLILNRHNMTPGEIYSVTQKARNVVDVSDFKPGQSYRMYTDAGSREELVRMIWQPNPVNFVVFELDESPEIYQASKPVKTRRETASAEIRTSLYEAMVGKDLSPMLAYKLSEIYAWEIDFFSLRRGDRFKLIFEKKYVDDQYFDLGDIIAAEFVHQGETYRAFRFNGEKVNGYFDGDGNSVQKALLKAPFKYSQRISSGFSRSRFHPVLKRRTPHYGVDYAAPYGTRVLAVGDGTVTEARYRGANGNIVKIRHNGTYETAYLHLKGFARGIRRGASVEQGQVIGYVGNTGRVTGTHLDYRIYRNGSPVNPLTVDLPASESIPKQSMEKFTALKGRLAVQLEQIEEENTLVRGTQ